MRRTLGAAIGVAALIAALSATAGSSARAPFEPEALSVVSAKTFWLSGHRALLRTTDGGRHFERLHAAPAVNVRFADSRDGFAYGSNTPLYATHDGGRTWRRTPFHATALVTDAGRVYVLSGRRLLSARVDGVTWRATGLSFDPVNVAAVGRDVWVLGAAGQHEKLARSIDGGRSFRIAVGPCFPGLGGQLVPSSSRVVWAFCPTGMMGIPLRSSNGGATFGGLRIPLCCYNGTTLAPASVTTAVVSTSGGMGLRRSTDGGRTWRPTRAPRDVLTWGRIAFVDARVGFALVSVEPSGTEALLRTTDAGASWQRVPIR